MNLEQKARLWAIHWHGNQTRKYTGEPYWLHPGAVAALVKTVPHTDEMIAACWMHDTLEDTAATEAEMRAEFGDETTNLVVGLTDVYTSEAHPKLNRQERKTLERARIGQQSYRVKTIKLADLIDNSDTIVKYDPGFAKVYLHEKRSLLDECLRDADALLWMLADAIVRRGLREVAA
jgi:guanosine-3',5'-bis(diphosphate) 3'-pyrophosphohydrolase